MATTSSTVQGAAAGLHLNPPSLPRILRTLADHLLWYVYIPYVLMPIYPNMLDQCSQGHSLYYRWTGPPILPPVELIEGPPLRIPARHSAADSDPDSTLFQLGVLPFAMSSPPRRSPQTHAVPVPPRAKIKKAPRRTTKIHAKCGNGVPKWQCLDLGGCEIHHLPSESLPDHTRRRSARGEASVQVSEHPAPPHPTDLPPSISTPTFVFTPAPSTPATLSLPPLMVSSSLAVPPPSLPSLPTTPSLPPLLSAQGMLTPAKARTTVTTIARNSTPLSPEFAEKHAREQQALQDRRRREAALTARQKAESQRVFIHVWAKVRKFTSITMPH